MRSASKNVFAILLGFLLSGHAEAQQLLGIANSNYAGTNGLYLNPASIADSRQGFYFNLFTVDVHATNTYVAYDAPFSPWQLLRDEVPAQYRNADGSVRFREEYVRENLNGNPKLASVGGEVRGPSFALKLTPKSSLALTTRLRSAFQANNVSENVAGLLKTGIDDPSLLNTLNADNRFAVNTNAFAEVGFTYARVVLDRETHFLKAGATVKRLVGVYSGHLINRGASYRIERDPTDPSQSLVRIDNFSAQYGYVEQDAYDTDRNPVGLDWLTGNGAPGAGWGFDLGFTYEYRPEMDKYHYTMDGEDRVDAGKNKYKYRVGVALTDMGGIRYRNPTYVRSYDVTRNDRTIDPNEFAEADDADEVRAVLERQLGLQNLPYETSFRSGLPTAFNVNFDYRLTGKLYANLTWIGGLRGKEAVAMRQNAGLALTPRLEMKWLELAFPLSLMNNYRTFALGAAVKLGPVFVGSDNLGGLFNLGTPYGANVYAGVAIPFYQRKPKDKDKDGVSNRKDNCRTTPGRWEFKGCPDTDNDQVTDAEDACPNEPGLPELKGCPEPDADADGVPDKNDECPNEAGSADMKGCPDRDADGVRDKEDQCPNEKGLVSQQGCPDGDGDGLADRADDCPTQAGSALLKGCPDRDSDGVADQQDRCPDVAGSVSNGGCPVVVPTRTSALVLTAKEIKVLKEAFDNLEFQVGKAVISAKSLPSLDELAGVLTQQPAYRLRIDGHTDNVGNAAANRQLSRARANAVRDYLVKQGVATGKFVTEGFGSTKPVTSNKTAAGRQKNRRVEMKIIK
ncbi:MAG: OmpA family protein [Ferruginibacter sp.]|nr:OmpA family protein [Cytophagales bacterium]